MKESVALTFSNFDTIKQTSSCGVEYWSARDVRDLLEYAEWRNFENTLKQAMKTCKLARQEVHHHFVVTQRRVEQGRAYRMIIDYALTRYALHLLLAHCDTQRPEIAFALTYLMRNSLDVTYNYKAFAQEVGAPSASIAALTKEEETIGQIVLAFQHDKTIKQHVVGKYRVDLYFPVHRIALECDEYGHTKYSQQEEFQRQKYIEDMLGCTFIRYNPDAKDFNIGEVINKIIMLIYHGY